MQATAGTDARRRRQEASRARCALAALLVLGAGGLSGCSTPPLSLRQLPAPPPPESCPYKRVYLVPKNHATRSFFSRAAAAADLQDYLQPFAEALSDAGLWIVAHRADAYWTIHPFGYVGTYVSVGYSLSPEPALARHLSVFLVENPSFPYRGALGFTFSIGNPFTFSIGNPVRAERRQSHEQMRRAVAASWERESEQIEAACRARARALAEGWETIEGLRRQLVEEMARVRRRRSRAKQRMDLEIDAEPGHDPQRKVLELEVERAR